MLGQLIDEWLTYLGLVFMMVSVVIIGLLPLWLLVSYALFLLKGLKVCG